MTWCLCVELAQRALLIVACVVAPVLALVLAAGVVINVAQASSATSDPTTAAVPRLIVGGLALAAFGAWMLSVMAHFWADLWTNLPHFVR